MFDEESIKQMKMFLEMETSRRNNRAKPKHIPASDARLRAMAKVYWRDRDTIYFTELTKSLGGLKPDERVRFDAFLEKEKGK